MKHYRKKISISKIQRDIEITIWGLEKDFSNNSIVIQGIKIKSDLKINVIYLCTMIC